MSIITSNCSQIANSPVNTSKTKQLFSFPKSDRFSYLINCSTPFYNLPDVKNGRSTTLGRGDRNSFTISSISPPPGSYKLPSDFAKDSKKGFQFGIGRDAYAKVYVESAPPLGKEGPGPGAYSSSVIVGKAPPKFTMRIRTPNPESVTTIRIVPGPGQYKVGPAIDPKGKLFYAKYKSSGAPLFSPPSSVRFKQNRDNAPGPGHYGVPPAISHNGSYFVSKFKSSGSVKFLNGSRTSTSKITSLLNPGPGTYKLPSEFGYYESKFAQTMDAAQWKAQTKPKDRMAKTQSQKRIENKAAPTTEAN